MFKLFAKKQKLGETVILKISGMHCTSCSLNIDGELEDTPGVIRANTSYAKQHSIVEYDSAVTNLSVLTKVIEALGYQAVK